MATFIKTDKFFTIRSHLHFKSEFTPRGLKNFRKKLPPVGIELTLLTITGYMVECIYVKMGQRGMCYLTEIKVEFASCTISDFE